MEALEVPETEEATPGDRPSCGETRDCGDAVKSSVEFGFEIGGEGTCWGGSWMSRDCCFFDLEPKPMTAARLNLEEDFEETMKALGDVVAEFVTEVMKGCLVGPGEVWGRPPI